jgi:hypothetical protein
LRARAHVCLRAQPRPARAPRARLDEGVDGQDGEVGLALGVVNEVQVNQLLQLQVLSLPVLHDVCEQHGHVLADRHGGDDCAGRARVGG